MGLVWRCVAVLVRIFGGWSSPRRTRTSDFTGLEATVNLRSVVARGIRRPTSPAAPSSVSQTASTTPSRFQVVNAVGFGPVGTAAPRLGSWRTCRRLDSGAGDVRAWLRHPPRTTDLGARGVLARMLVELILHRRQRRALLPRRIRQRVPEQRHDAGLQHGPPRTSTLARRWCPPGRGAGPLRRRRGLR